MNLYPHHSRLTLGRQRPATGPSCPAPNWPSCLADLDAIHGRTALPLFVDGRPMQENTILHGIVRKFSDAGL